MRLAYISFEYPPDTAYGGISTYVAQIAPLMVQRGHHVDVFCASETRTCYEQKDGVGIYRLQTDRYLFSKDIVAVFAHHHDTIPYDIIESSEYEADGYWVKKRYPALPLVVKLHTPTYMIVRDNKLLSRVSFFQKLRFYIGQLRRFQFQRPYWLPVDKEHDVEYWITRLADEIHTPSVSLGALIAQDWSIDHRQIYNVPNVFIPSSEYLSIPLSSVTNYVTYIGTLQERKGILQFIEVIPRVLARFPAVKFRFVGRDTILSNNISARQYMSDHLDRFMDNIEFVSVTKEQIPGILASTDVCVFPSVWENFPNVCLEAMSAGRAVVGSKNGGMSDMIEHSISGLLVDPCSISEITDAIVALLDNKQMREDMGHNARQRVLSLYSGEHIGSLVEDRFTRVIAATKMRGTEYTGGVH